MLPYFSGERTPINDPKAKGVIFGLGLHHTRDHIYNACLEGIGYGIASHIRIFNELHAGTSKIMAVGGGTKHAKWLQIVSDICGCEQHVAREGIGAAFGDALLAGLGAGLFRTPEDLAGHIQTKRSVTPDETTHRLYQACFQNYIALYESTKHIMHSV